MARGGGGGECREMVENEEGGDLTCRCADAWCVVQDGYGHGGGAALSAEAERG